MLAKIKLFFTKGDDRSLSVKKNMIGSIFIKGISILIQLILVPLTLGYLSQELYGIWLTISSIILWLNFFDVGLTLGLKNKLSEALARNEIEKGKSLVSTTYLVMVLIFLPLCIVGEIIIPHINWSSFLNVDSIYNEELSVVVSILIVCFCLQMVFNVITAVVSAYQKVALASAFPVIGNLCSVIVIYLLGVFTKPSLTNLASAISYLPTLVLMISSYVLYTGILKQVRPSISYFDKSKIRDILNLGIKFFIIQIQMIVLYQATNILISNVSSPTEVTSYNIAYKYIGAASMTFNIILAPLWPAFTDAYMKNDWRWMKQTYSNMKKVYYGLLLGVILMVILWLVVIGISVYNCVCVYRLEKCNYSEIGLVDTTINHLRIDSIEIVISQRDSIIYNIKYAADEESKQAASDSTYAAIRRFIELVSDTSSYGGSSTKR